MLTRFNTGHWTLYARVVPPPVASPSSPDHQINPNIVVLFREPALHRRLVLEAMTGRAELPDRSINHEWSLSLDEAPDPDVPLRRQGRPRISPSSGFLCSERNFSDIVSRKARMTLVKKRLHKDARSSNVRMCPPTRPNVSLLMFCMESRSNAKREA